MVFLFWLTSHSCHVFQLEIKPRYKNMLYFTSLVMLNYRVCVCYLLCLVFLSWAFVGFSVTGEGGV